MYCMMCNVFLFLLAMYKVPIFVEYRQKHEMFSNLVIGLRAKLIFTEYLSFLSIT